MSELTKLMPRAGSVVVPESLGSVRFMQRITIELVSMSIELPSDVFVRHCLAKLELHSEELVLIIVNAELDWALECVMQTFVIVIGQ